MTTYKVKVVGHGVIFRTNERERAERRAALCVPQAQARVIAIPESR